MKKAYPSLLTALLCLSSLALAAGPVAKSTPAPGAPPVQKPTKATFKFNDPRNRDTVTFMLDAPLETINGLSNWMNGQVSLDGQTLSGELRVPVNTIKTGNSTRDGHLQNESWLSGAKHPDIVATFKDVKIPAPLESGKPQTFPAKASFTIRGQTFEEPVTVTTLLLTESEETKNRLDGDLLRIKAKFQIPLEKYGIKRERALILKVAETAEVSVDAWGSTKL